jgi:deoxyribose-phosphate aldolase
MTKQEPADLHDIATLALRCLDLTSLRDDDTDASVERLADMAVTSFGAPAALCVYPRFVRTARARLDHHGLQSVRVATVSNFPDGDADVAKAIAETHSAMATGADEVDVVLPWRAVRSGDAAPALAIVAGCRALCDAAAAPVLLKVILETGELGDAASIRKASEIALEAGADFIKTSTGKVRVNATIESATIMLETIRTHGAHAGFKASGGVATIADAARYLTLADRIMGPGWATPATFRFGASGLLSQLVAVLEA